jgi:hypothetical protein
MPLPYFLCWSWRQATNCFANYKSHLSTKHVTFLERAKFPSDAPSDDHPTTPKPLHKHLKLRTQKSKMLLRISVPTANPTTSKCTQIATKPCNFSQINWTHYIYNSIYCNHLNWNQLFAKSHQLINCSKLANSNYHELRPSNWPAYTIKSSCERTPSWCSTNTSTDLSTDLRKQTCIPLTACNLL